MRIVLLRILCVMAIVTVSGGATNLAQANEPADAGAAPVDYAPEIERMIKAELKDPYSAFIEVGEAELAECRDAFFATFYGWVVPVTYNAKNSFGAYVGEKRIFFWYNDGELLKVADEARKCQRDLKYQDGVLDFD